MSLGEGRTGLKVLVVEDETLVCMMIEDMLLDLGCTLIGPASDFEKALALAGEALIDVAILDVNLDGIRSEPVADRLSARGVPLVFATGYGRDGISERYQNAPVLKKPFTEREMRRALAEVLAAPVADDKRDGDLVPEEASNPRDK